MNAAAVSEIGEKRFLDPALAIHSIGIYEGSRVADIGAGSGAYALALARVVGAAGRVYAIDVQQDMLKRLANEAARTGAKNIEVIWGDVDRPGGSKLADGSVDAVIFSNVLFQLEAKEIALLEARRILKPKGTLAIIDWRDSFGGMGPHEDDVVSIEQAKQLLDGAGFAFKKEFEAGAHHYGILGMRTV